MEQKSILIVEDDAIVSVHLRNTLTGLGYSATGPIATGEEAIAISVTEPPDLILMDIQLAGEIDGITTASRIRSAVDVPIIFLTSYSQDPLIQRAKTIVPYGYLLKPVSEKELSVTIEMAFYRHTVDRQLKDQEVALRKAHDELESRVQERTDDLRLVNDRLRREMEVRWRIGAALQESNRMLQALSLVQSHYISGMSIQDLFKMVLEDFITLTDSKIGFIGELLHTPAGDGYIKTYALTNIAWNEESRKIYEQASVSGLEFHKTETFFGAVLKTGKAIIANDPATDPRRGGLPEGHPPLDAFLGLPIHHGKELVGLVGLANRPGGYDNKLVDYVRPFLITCGNIIEAGRNRERREAAENLLRESEERYRRITEGLTDYLYTVRIEDGMAKETTHGPACEAVTGYTPREYAADPTLWMRMILEEDRDQVTEHIRRTLAGEKVPLLEHRIIHKNGQIRWVSGKRILQFDSRGKVVAYDGVIKDITERKQAEVKLFNSKATLTTVFDGISDPFIMLDAKLRIKRLNRAAKDYYRLKSFKEAVGKLCFEAFKGKSSPCEGCEHCFSGIQEYSGSYERKGEMDPDRLEQVFVDMVKDATGVPEAFIIRIHDITQARMMDRQLIQSEKLASLGMLVAGIAHEINNPNNFIYFNTPIMRSYLHFLLPIVDEYASAHPDLQAFSRPYPIFREDCFKLLDNIEHGSTRINQIVGNLREFVRERGKGERRRIDLKQVVEKSISICLGRIKKTVMTFKIDIPEGLPAVFTDPLAVEQIVVNLLINAAQAVDKDDSWIRLTITGPNETKGEVIVEVSDNGCGMDAETQRKIFDPFFTTKAVDVGTGLGMSISHRLVTELGGRIEVISDVGKGSMFRVVLPITSS